MQVRIAGRQLLGINQAIETIAELNKAILDHAVPQSPRKIRGLVKP